MDVPRCEATRGGHILSRPRRCTLKRCEGCGCMRSHSFRRLSWRPSTARIRSPTASTPEEERAAGCEHGRRVGGVRRAGGARRAGGGRRGRLLGCGRRRTDARRVLFDRDDHVEVVEPDAERAVAAVHTQRHRRVLRRAPLAARTRLAARRRHPATAAAASGDHHSARVVLRARRRAARDSRGVTAADGQVVARLGRVDREPVAVMRDGWRGEAHRRRATTRPCTTCQNLSVSTIY